jgi:hypothetical protein
MARTQSRRGRITTSHVLGGLTHVSGKFESSMKSVRLIHDMMEGKLAHGNTAILVGAPKKGLGKVRKRVRGVGGFPKRISAGTAVSQPVKDFLACDPLTSGWRRWRAGAKLRRPPN